MQHFSFDLNPNATKCLDLVSRGSFTHMTMNEGKAILYKILQTTLFTDTYDDHPEEPSEGLAEYIREVQAPRKKKGVS